MWLRSLQRRKLWSVGFNPHSVDLENDFSRDLQVEFSEPASWEVIKQTLIDNEFPPEDEHSI